MQAGPQIRRTLIEIAQRCQHPGTGSTLQLLTARTHQVQFPDLTPILHPIPWAVVGAVATRLYMPERATRDLDIVVPAAEAAEVRQRLAKAGFRYETELTIAGSSWTSPDGCCVDVLEPAEFWLPQAISEAQQNRDAQGLPLLPLPYLVLMKFQAGRVQDLADITRMLAQARKESLARVRLLFASRLPEEVADLESLIVLGQLEIQPPQTERHVYGCVNTGTV
ncbi:hypothetical protein NKDENANG_00136 [Candidatus Entotheonellaceae bacterium PAL068K]